MTAITCPDCVLGCVNTRSHSWQTGCIPCPTCHPEREVVTCEFCLGPAPIDQYHPTLHDEGSLLSSCGDCLSGSGSEREGGAA